MRKARALAVTAGTVVAGLAAGATSVSAYSISGGNYTGTANSWPTITVGGFYTLECFSGTYSGYASGSATTSFTPSHSGCTFFGFPATVSQSGPWSVTVTDSVGGAGFLGNLTIPSGTTTTIAVPIAGCTVTIQGAQWFSGAASALNASGGAALQIKTSSWVSYTASGCPFSSGSFGEIDLGVIAIPGVTFS